MSCMTRPLRSIQPARRSGWPAEGRSTTTIWSSRQGFSSSGAASEATIRPPRRQCRMPGSPERRRRSFANNWKRCQMADSSSLASNPFRCPPGPYERASLMGYYLKSHKPKSKILILDANDSFAKQDLFMEAWARLYPGMIEWVPGSQSGKVIAVDTASMTVSTDFDDHKAAVANIIPPQRAGEIATAMGLDQGTGYCAIDPVTFESKVHRGIYVLGDATLAGAMPKSGFSANNQAKACGTAILANIAGRSASRTKLLNICYSMAKPDYAFSIVDVFEIKRDTISLTFQDDRTTRLQSPDDILRREADY